MNITWRKGLVVSISFICLVLLICAIAGNDWVHDRHDTVGLWRVCYSYNHYNKCTNKVYFDDQWFQGVRALITISTLLGVLALLFALPTIFLEEGHSLEKLSNPHVIAGILLVAGALTVAASQYFLDETSDRYESGWTSAMGLASGIICIIGAILLVVTKLFVRCRGDQGYETISD